jgi:hypothetical protein
MPWFRSGMRIEERKPLHKWEVAVSHVNPSLGGFETLASTSLEWSDAHVGTSIGVSRLHTCLLGVVAGCSVLMVDGGGGNGCGYP